MGDFFANLGESILGDMRLKSKIEEQRLVQGDHGKLTFKNGSIPSRNKKKKKQFEGA